MLKAVLPLALVFAAGTALACGAGKSMDAKADMSPSVTAALATKSQQSKAAAPETDKKAVKPAEAKKPAT